MRTHLFPAVFLCLFFILFSTRIDAQIPRIINYQGALTDNSGKPAPDGSHVVTFNLYREITGGTYVYFENQTVQITGGIVSASIGSQSAFPASLKFDSAYYLGIKIDGGAELSPRVPLTSSPYSLNSAFAQNAGTASNAVHSAVADSANALSSTITDLVRSVNGRNGDIIIQGVGSTKVSTSGTTISINVPPGTGNGIQGVSPGDTSIIVANPSGPVALVSVAPAGINNSKMAPNAIATANIQDLAVSATKISSNGATKNFVPSADGNGNVAWTQAILQMPYLGLGTNLTGSVFTIANLGATGTTIRGVAGIGASLGIVTNAAIWGDGGANYFGVVGYSDGGSSSYAGIQGRGNNSSAGVAAVAASGDAITAISTTGRAGFFQITNISSSANGLEVSNAGSGDAIKSSALKDGTTGVHGIGAGQANSFGVLGETLSASAGSNALTGPTGVFGKASSTTPAAWSAGVRGVNVSTTGNGIGVVGYQAGSGWGVYGETPSGNAIYGKATDGTATNNGVVGETMSPNGAAVKATYTGTGAGTALQVDNGAIKVSGTNKAAFVLTVTSANKITATNVQIDNPFSNNDPNAILLVTNQVSSGNISNKNPIAVVYNTTTTKWEISNINGTALTAGTLFNVLIIKQQ